MIVITCAKCKNYIGDRKCEAFPVKIPDVIWEGYDGHEKIIPNQGNKIIFDPIEKSNT